MRMHEHTDTQSNLLLPGSESDWGCLTYILADMYTGREEMKSLSAALPLSVPYPVFFSGHVLRLLDSHTQTRSRGEGTVKISFP